MAMVAMLPQWPLSSQLQRSYRFGGLLLLQYTLLPFHWAYGYGSNATPVATEFTTTVIISLRWLTFLLTARVFFCFTEPMATVAIG